MDSGRNVLGPVASCVAVVLEKCPPPRASKTTSGKANRRPRAGPLESEHHCGAGKEIFFSLQIVKKKDDSVAEMQHIKVCFF